MKAKVYIATIMAAATLCGAAVFFYAQYKKEAEKNSNLTQQLSQLREKEKKSVIMRSVSTQMEEIAYQQKSISDKQRSEAWQQTVIANNMRAISDIERQKALIAERQAVASQQKAVTASQTADSQRRLADERRLQAEHAKRTADTLNANTLARSLGAQSIQRYQAKNEELGELLAYAAYYISVKYKNKPLSSDVYRALALASDGNTQWNLHQGGVTAIATDPNNHNRFVTVDNYGGIEMHLRNGRNISSKTVISSKVYDFRDVYIDNNSNVYALSRNGLLYVKPMNSAASQVTMPQAYGLMRIMPYKDDKLLLVAEKALYVYDMSENKIISSKTLAFKTNAAGLHNGKILLFDINGNEYTVNSLNDITSRKLTFANRVTAYTYSKQLHAAAYGTNDGIVYILSDGGKTHKLEGHRSRISQLRFAAKRLYSSSYDGSVKFCDFGITPLELSNAYSGGYWVYCLATDISEDEIWTGNQHGAVTRTLVSTEAMAGKIKADLKREFTYEEWDKYIGSFMPYTKFK